MPTQLDITTFPKQKSAPGGEFANYLVKIVPEWVSPRWLDAYKWRTFVQNQPLAVVARDTLIAQILSLDWQIIARDSNQQDELKGKIKYYTKLFENGSSYYTDLDFSSHVEWVAKDMLDLPFGGASEIGREGDTPNGKVLWIRPLDGGTLAPTLDRDFPIIQRVPNVAIDPVIFPYYTVSRIYMSPRTEIQREGWGMAPPEKIYLAMELMYRGDSYYANLLLNTPEIGILDLGDMEKESAQQWIDGFRDLLVGVNPFKIPVLYEHTTETKWIPFGKLPNDLMFDHITLRYASLIAAGYGMSVTDLGFPTSASGGQTLAGTIRQERRTQRTGHSTVKKKLISYFNTILPEDLEMTWIDYDDEHQLSMGRARLASANAWSLFLQAGVFSPTEVRKQTIQDGLLTITVPEAPPPDAVPSSPKAPPIGANSIGTPQKPSLGGQGDITPQTLVQRSEMNDTIDGLVELTQKSLDVMAKKADPVIHVYSPDINYTPPTQPIFINPTPIQVTNEVNPTPVEITNEVTSPDVVVNVDAPQVDITNQVQPTPIEVTNEISAPDVTVNNQVNPTPVEITNQIDSPDVTVNLKQADKLVSTVYRDASGRIAQVDTENQSDVINDG